MFKDIPVDVGVVYEGERIRKKDMYVELGGPKIEHKFELFRVRPLDEVEDEKIEIIGPDLKEMEEGKSYPFGILIEAAGKEMEELFEGVMERRIHEYCNYVQGFMHLNQRYDIWCRVGKRSFQKGFDTLKWLGKVLIRLFKSEFPMIEKIQVTFITDPEKIVEPYNEALKIYEARDARVRGMRDEDVDVFYGCTLCQSFAPTHCCVITPERYANCGAISWLDGRAAVAIDPKGPIFEIPKGECLDPVKGEYSGANEALAKKTFGAVTRVWLYTAFGYPHTSCGCFEAAAFYIPEVDGFGIVHRGFKGVTVNGLTFGQIADSTAGGRQVDGFHGLSIEYMRSRKFLQADGGWKRIVWLPSELKERVKDAIPPDLIDKIATEKDVGSVDELKQFLEEKGHPVVERWKELEIAEAEAAAEEAKVISEELAAVTGIPISLTNVRIYAKKLIIRGK
ncbi:MAG: CO dehydrogenase/CO-methylating acetyl-CoA synthase complex subunit beta [Candidatus Baldrarchaeota archaeon]